MPLILGLKIMKVEDDIGVCLFLYIVINFMVPPVPARATSPGKQKKYVYIYIFITFFSMPLKMGKLVFELV